MFDAESCFDNAMARSIASFVGIGGGLLDRSVADVGAPSYWGKLGVTDLAFRSRSIVSGPLNRVDDGRTSSLTERSRCSSCNLDHSAEIGLVVE